MANYAMLGQCRASYLLVEFESWGIFGVVIVTPQTGFFFPHHCGDCTSKGPPLVEGRPQQMIVLGVGEDGEHSILPGEVELVCSTHN